jgi:small-conductance mechanosensitive channel
MAAIARWMREPFFEGAPDWLNAAVLLKLLLWAFFVVLASAWLKRLLLHRVFPRFNMDRGQAEGLGTVARYAALILGLFIAVQNVGVDLSSVGVIFGALGVGIGLSLQAVTSNFFSGLVILLERPIQVGDRVQIGDLNGKVQRIRMRGTEVLTNDEIMVIVPNTEFIVSQVINWSRGGDEIRVHVPIGVAYGSEVAVVRKALMEAADAVPAVLKDPAPKVWFTGFGNSSLDFEVLCWTREYLHSPRDLTSQVNFAIHAALLNHGITIPFPQRDLHLKTPESLSIRVERSN